MLGPFWVALGGVVGLLGFATGCPDDDLGNEIENEIENIGAVEATQSTAPMAVLDLDGMERVDSIS